MSGYVRTRLFCCCLPVRFGVFILSLFGMVGGSLVAAVGWFQITQLAHHPVDRGHKIALWIHSCMFSLLVVLAALGFIGCLFKSRGMVSSFAVGLAIHLGFSVAAGIFAIYTIFKQNIQESIDECVNGSTDPSASDLCRKTVSITRVLVIVVYIIGWLIQLYAYFVVERYVDQLDDEKMSKMVAPNAAPQVQNFGPTYAFTSPRAAYGVAAGHNPSNHV